MSEMKMSDYFDGEVEVESVEILNGDTGDYDLYINISDDSYHNNNRHVTASHLQEAVSNHDSLVEEVERLRGERDELKELLKDIVKHADHVGCNDWFVDEANELLAKIEGEDNE